MGACWVINNQAVAIFRPDFDLSSDYFQSGALDPREIGSRINEEARIFELKDSIYEYFEGAIEKRNDYIVKTKIEEFINHINNYEKAKSIPVKNTKDGTPITLVEEDMKKRYPLDYKAVIKQARTRYSNFKQDDNFHARMKEVKQDSSVYNVRYLDPGNEKSSTKGRYNTAVFEKHLDNHYIKVKK
jgi:hypothetical protein